MRHPSTVVLAALVIASCAGAGSTPAPSPEPSEPPAVLHVDNQSWANFSIFVSWEGLQQRLGRSRASTTARFDIPQTIVGPGGRRIRFIADPIGARVSAVTREIPVLPGDTVHLVIPPR